MNPFAILLFHFLVYSFPVFMGAIFSKEAQASLNYVIIGVIFTLTQLFDTLYTIKMPNDIYINGGDIAYSALLFSSIFLIISQPEAKNVRFLIHFILILNIFLSFIFILILSIEITESVIFPLEFSRTLLQFSWKSLLYSFFLYAAEILLLLYLLRKILPKIQRQIPITLVISISFFLILILDGLLYTTGINWLIPQTNLMLRDALCSKIIFGFGFGSLLFVYLNFFPSKMSEFIKEQKSFLLYLLPPKKRALIQEFEKAKQEIKLLRNFLPICIKCKKIRDDEGYWTEIDQYFRQHSDINFSHGYCEKCFKDEYPEFADEILDEIKREKVNKNK